MVGWGKGQGCTGGSNGGKVVGVMGSGGVGWGWKVACWALVGGWQDKANSLVCVRCCTKGKQPLSHCMHMSICPSVMLSGRENAKVYRC